MKYLCSAVELENEGELKTKPITITIIKKEQGIWDLALLKFYCSKDQISQTAGLDISCTDSAPSYSELYF